MKQGNPTVISLHWSVLGSPLASFIQIPHVMELARSFRRVLAKVRTLPTPDRHEKYCLQSLLGDGPERAFGRPPWSLHVFADITKA